MGLGQIDPPLLNSASPWATTEADLQQLYDCLYTGAITTRTSLLNGFAHDDTVHQYTYFDSASHSIRGSGPDAVSSLNTLGYSPIPLREYLEMISRVVRNTSLPDSRRKPCLVSVTGSAEEVVECYSLISSNQIGLQSQLCMEVNLSCPNIPGKPPPAYSKVALSEYLTALGRVKNTVLIGLKTPPYTYHDQFRALIDALLESPQTIDFITTTNTLGSSLVLNDACSSAVPSASGVGIGGMAGPALHPLALGNVKTIRSMLDQHAMQHIDIVGVGGVYDRAGFNRMRAVGAKAVAIGTALGAQGISAFERILNFGVDVAGRH